MEMTEKQNEEMKLLFSQFQTANFWKVSETRCFTSWRARIFTKKKENTDKLLHLFMSIRTTVQHNKFEVTLLNNFKHYAFQHIRYVSEVKKRDILTFLFLLSNPVHGTGTCVYISKCILLAPSVATKTAWQSYQQHYFICLCMTVKGRH